MAEANQTTPRRRRRRLWPALAVFCVGAAAAVLFHVFTRGTPLERLKADIRREVPVGTPRARLAEWAKTRWGQAPHVTLEPLPDDLRCPTLAESAGVPPEQRGIVLDVMIRPCGSYRVNGEVCENQLWALFPLNERGEVTGQYFLTLADLAAMGR